MKSLYSKTLLFAGATAALAAIAGCSGGSGAGGSAAGAVRAAFPFSPNYLDIYTSRQRWPKTDLGVFVDTGAESRSVASVKQAVLDGAGRWTDPTGGVLHFHLVDTAAAADIEVKFVPPTDPDVAGAQLGLTRVEFLETAPDLTLTKARVVLEAGLSDDVVRAASAHEIGHALGLISRTPGAPQHSGDSHDLMFPVILGSSAVSLRDANSLAKLYADSRAISAGGTGRRFTVEVRCGNE